MTAANLAALFSFSEQLDLAFADALEDALPSDGLPVFPYFTNAVLPDSRIDVMVTVGQAFGPGGKPQVVRYDGDEFASYFSGEVQIQAVGRRGEAAFLATEGLVREAMSVDAVNSHLDFLQVDKLIPQRSSRMVMDDLDVQELTYAFTFSINPDAWPTLTPPE